MPETPNWLIDHMARHLDNEITNLLEHFGYLKKYMGQLEEAQKELRTEISGPGTLDHDSSTLRAAAAKIHDAIDRDETHRREFAIRMRFATRDSYRLDAYLAMYDATLDTLEAS